MSELTERARALFQQQQWRKLAALLQAQPRENLPSNPQLGFWLADAWRRLGRHQEALELLFEITPAIKRSGIARLELFRLNLLGMIRFETGEPARAEAVWRELLAAASREHDEEFVARANNNLGIIYTLHARPVEAVTCYERAIAAYRLLGLTRHIAQSHQNLGITYRELDRYNDADEHFQTAMRYAASAESEDEIARAEQERALLIYVARRDSRLARNTVKRALARFLALRDPLGVADSLRVLAMIELGEGELQQAREHAGKALAHARSAGHKLLLAEVQEVQASLAERAGQDANAERLRAEAEQNFAAAGASAWGTRIRNVVATLAPRQATPH